MKAILGVCVVLTAMTIGVPAQGPEQATPPKPATVSVSGCLQKTETQAYTLTSSERKRYQLRTANTEIRFVDHVDQRVTLTAAAGTSVPTKGDQEDFLDVVALVVQSQSCKA
jgi:hypothetical protein